MAGMRANELANVLNGSADLHLQLLCYPLVCLRLLLYKAAPRCVLWHWRNPQGTIAMVASACAANRL